MRRVVAVTRRASVAAALSTVFASLYCPTTLIAQTPVEISAADGHVLRGDYRAGSDGAPAVLLLHQCDADRSMYAGLAERIAGHGLHVLAFDLRGIGASASEAYDLVRQGGARFWRRAEAKMPGDVRAAFDWLRSAPGVNAERIGILGASCTGREAARTSADPDRAGSIRALGFLSARMSDAQVGSLAVRASSTPMLWIAAEGDRRAAAAARAGDRLAEHEGSRLLLFDGSAHGHPLFREHLGLIDEIAAWFRDVLAERQAEAP